MEPELIAEYLKQFATTRSLCDWSRFFSAAIWEKIEFCRSTAKFNIYETTITQDLIYQFWQLAQRKSVPIYLYQSRDEKANGNDIEIYRQTSKGYMLFACQAKIVNKNGRYPAIRHQVNGTYQIDLLLKYAQRMAGIPLYLLYNHHLDPIENSKLESRHKVPIHELGCSLFPAETLKSKYWNASKKRLSTPKFIDLHQNEAVPLSTLFCPLVNNSLFESLQVQPSKLRLYEESELFDQRNWEDMLPLGKIGRISSSEERFTQGIKQIPIPSFNPRFRILLPIERRPRGSLISN
jgi:hypothetical protein